jgi:hypothetical protein
MEKVNSTGSAAKTAPVNEKTETAEAATVNMDFLKVIIFLPGDKVSVAQQIFCLQVYEINYIIK